MEENQDFLQLLEEGLKLKRTELDEETLPRLKEELRNFGNTFHILYTYLVQKGLLKEDLYNYDQSTKLEPPSSDPIPDQEMVSELSFRLSNYESVLDYMNNIYDVNMDKLNLGGIKKILAVLDYVKWPNLGSNTTHNITRGLTMVMDKIITSNNDPMSSEIRFNSIANLNNSYGKIKKYLKSVSIYQREAYKFRIRTVILPGLNPTSESVTRDLKGILVAAKLEITSQLPGEPFYRELIEEIFTEDFGYDGEAKKQAVLKSLNITGSRKKEVTQKKKTEKKIDKTYLLRIIPDVSKAADQLASAAAKLEHNREITSARKKSFVEVLKKFFNRKEEDLFYEVKTVDPVSGQSRKVRLNFTTLMDQIRKKTQLLRNIGNSNSQQYEKLAEYSEEMLMEFIENNLMELRTFHKKMVGLDEMFKKEEDPALRARIKGIKVETDTLKRLYMESNKTLKEYLSLKEEAAQLKALGIEG